MCDDGSIYLRAERTGSGDGRVYTITYEAVDDSGNATEASAEVLVPDGYRWRHRERIRPKKPDSRPKIPDKKPKAEGQPQPNRLTPAQDAGAKKEVDVAKWRKNGGK